MRRWRSLGGVIGLFFHRCENILCKRICAFPILFQMIDALVNFFLGWRKILDGFWFSILNGLKLFFGYFFFTGCCWESACLFPQFWVTSWDNVKFFLIYSFPFFDVSLILFIILLHKSLALFLFRLTLVFQLLNQFNLILIQLPQFKWYISSQNLCKKMNTW